MVQVSALAVGLLALVLLVLLRTDLVASWRRATPPDAPNRFVINVMPEQSDAFQKMLRDAGVQRFDWYPMIRGRLVAVNGRTVTPDDYLDDRAKRLLDREFNLSNSTVQPPHNQVVAGRWQPEERGAVSVEEGIANTLGLKMGDTLRFDIGGMQDDAKITSLRKVDWGSMRANFFVIYPVSRLQDVPVTYMGAFRAPERKGFDNELVRAFPNITNVDMTSTINQVQGVLDKVIRAVEFLFGFTLAAGVVVLFAAVTATREERAREFAIMRAVGASGALLRQVQRAELAGVGPARGLSRQHRRVGRRLGAGALRFRFRVDRLAVGAAGSARSPAPRWRSRPAGGACARCSTGRWSKRCGARRSKRDIRTRRARRIRDARRRCIVRVCWSFLPSKRSAGCVHGPI